MMAKTPKIQTLELQRTSLNCAGSISAKAFHVDQPTNCRPLTINLMAGDKIVGKIVKYGRPDRGGHINFYCSDIPLILWRIDLKDWKKVPTNS